MRRVSTASAQSINMQRIQCLQVKHYLSSNAHCVNNIELNINVNALIININA